MLKKISNVVINIVIILLVVLVASNFYLGYKYKKNPDKIPKIFGVTSLEVLSGSMLPTYEIGDHLVIKEVDINNLEKGDVITFRNKDNVVITHRIFSKEEKNGEVLIETKGDNNNTVDNEKLSKNNIIGKVMFNFALLRIIDQMTSRPMLLIGVILVIIAIMLVRELYKEKVATNQ